MSEKTRNFDAQSGRFSSSVAIRYYLENEFGAEKNPVRLPSKAILAVAATAWISFGVFAFAQTPSTPNTIATQSQPLQPPHTPSSAISDPVWVAKEDGCNVRDYYPYDARKAGLVGTVILGFTITTQGSLTDFKIVASSGSKMLDDAAISCASTWQYQPAIKDGRPIPVFWKFAIGWSVNGVKSNPVAVPVSPQMCPRSVLPADGSVVPNGVATTVFYDIAADGTVRDAVASSSSGDERLDQIALKCVSQWRYRAMSRTAMGDILGVATFKIPLDSDYMAAPQDFIYAPVEIGTLIGCVRPVSTPPPPADSVLVANLSADAVISGARLLQSSGSKQLDDRALACVGSLHYRAAARNGQHIPVTMPIRIVWDAGSWKPLSVLVHDAIGTPSTP